MVFLRVWIPTMLLASVALASDWKPRIPKTWDDAVIATHKIPLADPSGSPKHISAEYYYRIPVQPSSRVTRCMHRATSRRATSSRYRSWNLSSFGTTKVIRRPYKRKRTGHGPVRSYLTLRSRSAPLSFWKTSAIPRGTKSYAYPFRRAAFFQNIDTSSGPRASWKWEVSPARIVIRGSCRMVAF